MSSSPSPATAGERAPARRAARSRGEGLLIPVLQFGMRSSWRASKEMKSAAKEMRRQPTEAECALWEILRTFRAEGFPFRRQVPMGRFVLDFYCPAASLAVEANGGIHDIDSVARRDFERQQILKDAYQVDVLYLSNERILKESQAVRQLIAESLQNKSIRHGQVEDEDVASPSPATAGEGCPKGGVRAYPDRGEG